MDIYAEYNQVAPCEMDMISVARNGVVRHDYMIFQPLQMENIACRLLEVAKNSTVLRCGNNMAGLTNDKMAYESDGAHANLMRATMDCALDYYFGWGAPTLRYERRVINEAILLHDLPENVTGDTPDNRARDENKKRIREKLYLEEFFTKYSLFDQTRRVEQLLIEMEEKSSLEGRMLYLADKLSAITMMLCYDAAGLNPRIDPNDPLLGRITKAERDLCTRLPDGKILLSELWTVDFLRGREHYKLDDTGYFTRLLVMQTLLTHKRWYKWRKAQYISYN